MAHFSASHEGRVIWRRKQPNKFAFKVRRLEAVCLAHGVAGGRPPFYVRAA